MSKPRKLSRSGPRGGSLKNLYTESTTSDSTKKLVKTSKPREAGVTATWQAVGSFVSDFKSEYGATYTKNPLAVHPKFEPQTPMGFETERLKLQDKVITKLDAIAQKRYGSMRSMLAAFKKRPDDEMTLDEFSEHLKKRHLDTLFPREEQRLLFDRLDASNENRVSLSDLLRHCQEIDRTKETGVADDMRYTIANKLDEKRKESKLVLSARQTKLNLATNLRNLDPHSTGYVTKDQMVWAMGNDFMKLKLSKEEAQQAIEDIVATNKHIIDPANPEKINYFRFVRALRIAEPANDVNLFFDERERQIHLLKTRVKTLEKEASNEDLLARKQYLENELGIGLTGLQRYLAPLDSTLQTSQSMPTLTIPTMASDDTAEQRPATASSPDPAARTLTPIQVEKRPHRNSTKQIGGQFKRVDNEYTRDDAVRATTTASNDGTQYFKATTNHAAKTRLKDPSLVVLEQAHRVPKESHAVGKRRLPATVTDWNRIGFGGNSTSDLLESPVGFSTTASRETFAPDDRFLTTSNAYFAELKYEPSKPVRRDVVSDAELATRKKKERLKARHERTKANLKVIEQHIELDNISRELAHANVNFAKAQDVLKYETTVFLNDLKAFSKREVETRHRKTNDAMFNRMWGGQVHELMNGTTERDFTTTYSNTYSLPSVRADEISHS